MRAGRLRHRVIIEQRTYTTNAMGETVWSWSALDTVWASIEPNTGRRYYEAKQANSEVEGTIVMRYRSDMEPTMRVKYDSRIFQILAVLSPQEREKELHLLYKESAN